VLTGGYVGVQFMQPAAGSLQFTGHAPSLAAQTYLIPVPRGRIEWGQAVLVPTVFQAHIRALGAGQVVLTGEELNVSTPGTIVLPTGALALTGQALTIDWGTGIPKGSLVFTGHALSFPATSVVHEIDGRGSFARKIYGRASSTTGSSGRGSL
jgi:hypothetical protein